MNVSMKKDTIMVEGEVTETLPNTLFRVKLDTGLDAKRPLGILAHLSGKLRIHYIKIVEGDRVIIEMSPYDLSKGRIVRRLWKWDLRYEKFVPNARQSDEEVSFLLSAIIQSINRDKDKN